MTEKPERWESLWLFFI